MNHDSGDSTVVDPATRKPVANIQVGGELEFPVSDGAGKVFVNDEAANEIAVIDVKSRKTVTRYPLARLQGAVRACLCCGLEAPDFGML
jgi:DNA-binding beta-propeller fold protein YncE